MCPERNERMRVKRRADEPPKRGEEQAKGVRRWFWGPPAKCLLFLFPICQKTIHNEIKLLSIGKMYIVIFSIYIISFTVRY